MRSCASWPVTSSSERRPESRSSSRCEASGAQEERQVRETRCNLVADFGSGSWLREKFGCRANELHAIARKPRSQSWRSSLSLPHARLRKLHSTSHHRFRVFTHGVVPGRCHKLAQGIGSPRTDEASIRGRAVMETFDAALCRTGRVAEADGRVCCRSDRHDRARGNGCLQSHCDR